MTNPRPLGIPTPAQRSPFLSPPPPLTPCQLLWCNDNKAAYAEKHNSIVWKACTCHCHVIPAHLTIRQRINVGAQYFAPAPQSPPLPVVFTIIVPSAGAGAKY